MKDGSWWTLVIAAIPFILILFMTFAMMKSARKRQEEGVSVMEKEQKLQEENNKLLKEILKTLKHIDRKFTRQQSE
ncbi:MAG: hypothetical protein J7M18_07785 [Candidatus Eremiobacteraeota bacterium]|nr:hypothetical protein [Candidatus Eremiobacteraeota bacterium]